MEQKNNVDAYVLLDTFTSQIISEKFEEFVRNTLDSDHIYYYHYKKPFSYIDLFLQLRSFFINSRVGEEPFLRDSDIEAFCKRLLIALDMSSDIIIDRVQKDLKPQIEAIDKEIGELKQTFDLSFPAEDAPDFEAQIQKYEEESKKFRKSAEPFYEKSNRLYTEALQKAKDDFKTMMSYSLGNLFKKYADCESPLERALLIAIVAHAERLAHSVLLTDDLSNQIQIGNYRVDFLIKNEERNVKTVVELDGHTYHEKTEEQAARDRARDRDLVSQGYKVLRFHRKEIEENLRKCVFELEEVYSGAILDKEKIERKIQEARERRKQRESEAQ